MENGEWDSLYFLESYFYARTNKCIQFLLKEKQIDFLLDSGAFTYMQKASQDINWDSYIEDYAAFINKYKIDLFIELDIDSIVGIKEVERLRSKLEKLTNKQCIPVWHKSRGLQYWHKMVNEYKYVAIGGIVTREIKQSEYPIFNNLINIAKSKNCKVHGLGFTNLIGLTKYKFDSVDSTTWLYGNRKGSIYKFNGKTIIDIPKPEGTRLNAREAAINNFNEWVKFQKYAKTNL